MNWKLLFHTLACGLLTTWWICHSPLNKWVSAGLCIIGYILGVVIGKIFFSGKES